MPDLGQEATDGVLREDSVEIIRQLKEESSSARLPRKAEWDLAWNLYNNKYDFANKAEWQAKHFLPKVNTSCRQAVHLLKRGLVGRRDFFTTKGYGKTGEQIAPYVHSLAKFHLRAGGFVNSYATSLLAGMLEASAIMKVYPRVVEDWDYSTHWEKGGPALPRPPASGVNVVGNILASRFPQRRRKKKLSMRFEPVQAYDFYPDPHGEGLYRIHQISMDLHALKELAADPANHMEQSVVDLIHEDFVKAEQASAEAARKMQSTSVVPPRPFLRRRVQLDEFWGTMLDLNGNVLFRRCYAVMVNEKYMLVRPRPVPEALWPDPFIVAPIIERPFSVWHQSLVENVAGLQILLSEFINLMMDANLFASIKAFEVDMDLVFDPSEFRSGVYPGKVFKKRGGGMLNQPMLRDISLGNLSAQQGEIYSFLDREFQNGMGLNEFATPQMRAKAGRVTATEVLKKGQESVEFFGEVAKRQEERLIEPMLEKLYGYILHYHRDFSDPLLIELMGEEAALTAQSLMADPSFRDFMLSAPIKFTASGMSTASQRFQELEKIFTFMTVVGNAAKAMPQVLAMVNVPELLKMAVEALDWEKEKVLLEGPPTQLGLPQPNAGDMPGMPGAAAPNPLQGLNGAVPQPVALGGLGV